MTAADRCPTAADLEAFLLGRSPADSAADLERHLSACPACVARASGLKAEDGMVAAVRRARAADTPAPELTDALVGVFRRLVPAADGSTAQWVGAAVQAAPDLAPPSAPDAIGSVGPYPVFEILGAGGMGVVYRGFDPALQRSVAIKVIRPALVAAPGVVDRFLAEARAAAKVEHDHIVVVHAVEVHDGRPCLVMPLLKGETLEARLKGKEPLPAAAVLRVGRETAAALAAAHAAGLVHRDIKPGNLWLEAPSGRVRVLDFGLAVPAGGGAVGFAGTPGYMAPEQVRGGAIDERADLFSLGCVLYRAAAGAGPFDADTASGSVIRTLTRTPTGVRAVNPAVPPDLADLIDRLLARDPADRPATAALVAELLAAMEAAILARHRRKVRRRWVAGLVTAAGLGGLAAWLFQPPPPAPPSAVEVTIATDPDAGPLVLDGADGEVRVEGGREVKVALAPGTYAVRAAAGAGGRVAVPADFVVRADEPRRVPVALVGEVAKTRAHSGPVTGVATVRDGDGFAVLSVSSDRTLQRWEPGKPGDPPPPKKLDAPAESLAVTSDGTLALTAGGSKSRGENPTDPFGLGVTVWNARTLEKVGEPLILHTRLVRALAVSADGRQAISTGADEAYLWSLRDRIGVPLKGHDARARVVAAALDPAGRFALTGDDTGTTRLWELGAGEPKSRPFAPPGRTLPAVRAVGFLPDGFVTAGDDGAVWVWDREFRAARLPATPDPGAKAITALAVASDGRRLVTGGADGAVRLWSAPRGELIHTFAGHHGVVRGVAFTPDGRGAASAGEDQTVRVWRLPFE